MDSSTLLDFTLFQLTLTRTRCDLVLVCGSKSEKLASGLFEPFVSHLNSARDGISRGGYSIKLCPPDKIRPIWFTKATFERFVNFVGSPATLERFVLLEREILQIESSAQAGHESNSGAALAPEEGWSAADANIRQSTDSSKIKGEKKCDAVQKESSRIQLRHFLETRRKMPCKEQALAYARALVAGFEMEQINDLILFSDAFGASRLREACINFKELAEKKCRDGLWMQELAAVEACPTTELSILGTLGFSSGDLAPNGSLKVITRSLRADAIFSNQSSNSNAIAKSFTLPYAPMQQLHPYPGYPFPVMQPIPSHYPRNISRPPSKKDSSPAKEEKSLNGKDPADREENLHAESTDSEGESGSDSCVEQDKKLSSVYAPSKKNQKKSSKTVVIRNINYITSRRRNGESGGL